MVPGIFTDCTQRAVHISEVEARVENYYSRIQPDPQVLDELEIYLLDEIAGARDEATQDRERQLRRSR